MNEDMNFEFMLKEKFAREAPPLPDGLKKENVIAMLEKEKAVPKKKKKHIFLKVASVAAALVIVVASAVALPFIIPEKGLIEAPTADAVTSTTHQTQYKVIDNGLKATPLMQAESDKALRDHFVRIYRENKLDDFIDGVFSYGFYAKATETADGAMPESAVATGAAIQAPGAQATTAAALTSQVAAENKPSDDSDTYTNAAQETEESYGKTNTQVENVDEADIIKNDGKYLYILSGGVYQSEVRVTILSADDMKVASRISLDSEEYHYDIQEMYVNGDRLVLLALESEKIEYEDDEDEDVAYDMPYYGGYYYGEREVVSFVYDISDRKNPTLIREVSQDGSRYVSSRMIDGILYTVSTYWVSGDSEEEIGENSVPEVNDEKITCDCVYIYDYDSKEYVVVSAYDTKLDESKVSALSILGSGDEVYCSRDALYVAGRQYNNGNGNTTEIYSFSLDGADISYKASGAVKGTVLNQFSLDEHEGNLRIATTYYSYKHDVDVSSVYVLNKDLQLIGELSDIAYDEQVKSVRFMGDTGYIVTFRNTDPLFTLDLSDPSAPKVVGEVKLPGFSSYLHPVGDGLVVGLGYDGDEENADFSSIKVSLFDVSDLKNPKEVDTFVLKNVYSQALDNPKAFIHYPEENLIGFPVEHYDNETVLSYKLLKIENRVIESHLGYVHETERIGGNIFRGTYIGQKLYTIDNYNVCEFDIATADMLRSCMILDVEEDMPQYYRDDGNYDYFYGAVTTPAVAPGAVATTFAPEYRNDGTNADAYATTVGVTASEPSENTTVSVNAQPTTSAPYQSFKCKVVEVGEGYMHTEVTDSLDSAFSVGTLVDLPNDYGELEEGDILKVTFDGMVQETYPLQLPNINSVLVL